MDTQAPTSGWGPSPLAAYAIGYESNASRIASIDSYGDGLSQFYYDDSNQLTTAYHAAESGQANEAYANATTIS